MNFTEVKNKVVGFFSKIGKRNLIIIGAVALIGVAVLVNWIAFGGSDDNSGYTYGNGSGMVGELDDSKNPTSGSGGSTSAGTTDSYFSTVQVSRQRARDEAMEVLNAVLDNENASDTVKAEAVAEIKQLSLEMTQESDIESLVVSKGFDKCVAVVNGESASIVVASTATLTPAQLAQINAAVYEVAKIQPANVTVIAKAS